MKRMIGILKQFECYARTKLCGERSYELQFGELITSSLQKEHRRLHLEEVLPTLGRRPPGRVKRESEENQAADSRQRRCGLCLRSHATAKGFAACDKGKLGNETRRLHDRGADGGLGKFRSVRPLRAPLHVGKLIAQGGDPAIGKSLRNGCHKRVCHTGPCAMGQHVAGARLLWRLQQTGDAPRVVNAYGHRPWTCGSHRCDLKSGLKGDDRPCMRARAAIGQLATSGPPR